MNAGQNPLENGGVGLTFYDSVHLPNRGRWDVASPSGGPRQCGVWGGAPGSQKHAFTPAKKKGGFWPSLTGVDGGGEASSDRDMNAGSVVSLLHFSCHGAEGKASPRRP